jgi:hypothetical protein
MFQTFDSFNYLLRVLIGLLLFNRILCENKPKFCEDKDKVVDAVLWDGMKYRLTINPWIATYDESSRSVREFNVSDLNCKKNFSCSQIFCLDIDFHFL